jgi:hypothetical protein
VLQAISFICKKGVNLEQVKQHKIDRKKDTNLGQVDPRIWRINHKQLKHPQCGKNVPVQNG